MEGPLLRGVLGWVLNHFVMQDEAHLVTQDEGHLVVRIVGQQKDYLVVV